MNQIGPHPSCPVSRCRSADELDSAFKELEAQYEGEISRETASAKAKVFDNLDPTSRIDSRHTTLSPAKC